MSKQTLAFELSKFKVFNDANHNLEQYSTDSEIAASILWDAQMQGWINGKSVIDFGAGTGILGIGCILLGAKKVVFVEIDQRSIDLLKENLEMLKANFDISSDISIIKSDIKNIDGNSLETADLVVQNPPFGTKEKNMDSLFLEKAMLLSKRIITMHKTITKQFIDEFAERQGFQQFRYYAFNYPLKMTMPQHRKKIEYIKVSCWLLVKD